VQKGVLAQVAVGEDGKCDVAALGAFQVGGIVAANDLGEQPHRLGARLVGDPRRSVAADRIPALTPLAAILQDVDFRPGGGDLDAKPLDRLVPPEIIPRSRCRRVDNALGEARQHRKLMASNHFSSNRIATIRAKFAVGFGISA